MAGSSRVRRSVAFNNYNIPRWLDAKWSGWSSPDHLLSQFAINRPPVSVHDIARELGVFVNAAFQPAWNAALRSTSQRAEIWLNASADPISKRWMLAHELGHLMLHGTGLQVMEVDFSSQPGDSEANAYAADLLMPLWMLHPYVANGYPPSQLAGIFQVPIELASSRVHQLLSGIS